MKSRRAVASVVGMVFAIIALTTTITYISYSMGILNNYNQSVLVKNQQLTDLDKEKFQISSVTVPNGKLNITIADTGSLPIQFTKVWIQNTSATDQVYSYVPTHNFVSPGGILTNIGQSMTPINPADSYNVKVVTSRGNTQQFSMNSARSTPVNIQLYAFPPTVPSGFTTELVMVVTNNSTNVLTNLIPQISELPGFTATCNLGTVSPTIYNTLSPGNAATFKWDLTASGTAGGQSCTWVAQLKNGYPGNTAQVAVTVTVVQLGVSNYANYAGTLTMNYTQFEFANGTSTNNIINWYTGWQVQHNQNLAFSIKITNNNATSDFYISKQSFFWLEDTSPGGGVNNQEYYIVDSINPSPPFTINSYCGGTNDYCLVIPHGNSTVIYFGASAVSGNNMPQLKSATGYDGFLLFFGKFVNSQTKNTVQYGQNIPFVAVLAN